MGQVDQQTEAMRAAFETWAGNQNMDLRPNSITKGAYYYERTDCAWDAWQAALARPTANMPTVRFPDNMPPILGTIIVAGPCCITGIGSVNVSALVEALRYYANRENYKAPQTLAFHHFDYEKTPVLMDKGTMAGYALAAYDAAANGK